jgi:hypothetical protein
MELIQSIFIKSLIVISLLLDLHHYISCSCIREVKVMEIQTRWFDSVHRPGVTSFALFDNHLPVVSYVLDGRLRDLETSVSLIAYLLGTKWFNFRRLNSLFKIRLSIVHIRLMDLKFKALLIYSRRLDVFHLVLVANLTFFNDHLSGQSYVLNRRLRNLKTSVSLVGHLLWINWDIFGRPKSCLRIGVSAVQVILWYLKVV